jgi:general secretion pathway protein H
MRRLARKAAGFTLIELLLVLTITALLLSLAPPMLHKAFPSLKLKAAARDLIQEIRYIQNAAIINSTPAGIRFDLNTGEYRSELVNGGKLRSLPKGLKLSLEDNGLAPMDDQQVASFVFYPDGSSSGGAILLSNETTSLEIRVDWLTSKIQVHEPQARI